MVYPLRYIERRNQASTQPAKASARPQQNIRGAEVLGPKDRRVILLSNMKRNVAVEPMLDALFTANYTEQVTWRDAATGRGFIVMQVVPAVVQSKPN